MAQDIIKIDSLSKIHEELGLQPPMHPLISLIDASQLKPNREMLNQKISLGFYIISMKDGKCGMQYGRNYYDFEEGSLIFMAPHQVMSATTDEHNAEGWMLLFHPDLIRKSHLGQSMDRYTFFSYDVHEALHLSDREKTIMNDCVDKIQYEYSQFIDAHTQNLLVSNLELLLNYCMRFYERQFNTRSAHHSDTVSVVMQAMSDYFESEALSEKGLPTVQFFADKVNLSANYLSDMMKKETGKNIKEHINEYVVEKAKNLLLNTNETVSSIAYDLGFNYPHYFSRMFKTKTGMTPQEYREVN